MLLPFTGLPCPRAHKPAIIRTEKQQSTIPEEGREISELSDYRDSRESSADEEDREAEQQQEASYVPPMRQGPKQRVLLSHT